MLLKGDENCCCWHLPSHVVESSTQNELNRFGIFILIDSASVDDDDD